MRSTDLGKLFSLLPLPAGLNHKFVDLAADGKILYLIDSVGKLSISYDSAKSFAQVDICGTNLTTMTLTDASELYFGSGLNF